jgi:CheY-like chemotaxis protein
MARILVVDDDASLRAVVQEILTQAGHDVETACNGEEACETFKRLPVDLLIIDILMPEKEGIQTITSLHRDYPGLRIIAMSGGGQVSPIFYLEMAREFGADLTLQKPFGKAQILKAVEDLIMEEDGIQEA